MQLGLYARGPVLLPHRSYPKATLRLIERAIAEAWRVIRDNPQGDFEIATATEDRITRELKQCLMNAVLDGGNVPGFTSDLFHVTREGKFESFDGNHLDKMPDLHIFVRRDETVSLPSDDGLFAECKPVGRSHSVGVHYCDKGISRFVKGEYAWALRDAIMVGYVSAGYTLPEKLTDAFSRRKKILKLSGSVLACPDSSASGYTQLAHISVHDRGFTYPGTNTVAPEITLRHLWLNRN